MAIRFDELYDESLPQEKRRGLRPMGRNASGNKGISLRKGDYVVGAAITISDATRNADRDRLAAAAGPAVVKELKKLRNAHSDTDSVLRAARETTRLVRSAGTPDEAVKAAEKAAEKAHATAESNLKALDARLGLTPCLILSVTENGYGKRTDADQYRLQSRGGGGVTNLKATPKVGKVNSINLVDDTTEMMLISQFGKIIRIDTKTIRSAGRSTSGVKLLNLDTDDKVAAAVVIPPEDPKSQPENGTLLQ
jgi:DNA gyrase subunit A